MSGIVSRPDGSAPGERISIYTFSITGVRSIMAFASSAPDGRFRSTVRCGTAELLFDPEGFAPFRYELGELDGERTGLEFVLSEGFEGVVRFVDEDTGEPLSGVEVEARVRTDSIQGREREAVSGEDGLVRFSHMGELPLKLEAHLPGYGEGLWEEIALSPTQPVELALVPTEPLFLEVRSVKDGAPLAGVSLRMVFRISTGLNQSLGEHGPVVAESNDEGELVASSLRGGSIYYFLVEKEGYQSAFVGPFSAGESETVELRELRPVEFEISGLPESEGEVEVAVSQTLETPGFSSGIGREEIVVPVSDGEAVLSWSPPVRTPVQFEVAGKRLTFESAELDSGPVRLALSSEEEPEEVPAESGAEVRFGELTISVRVPGGEPPPEGKLVVGYLRNGDVRAPVRYSESRVLDLEAGMASLDVPYPNEINIRSEGVVGYWFEPIRNREVVEPGSAIEIEAAPAGAIYGSVSEPDGAPADNLLIGVFQYRPSDDGNPHNLGVKVKNSARRGDGGSRFLASPLPLGKRYVIRVSRGFTYFFSKPRKLTEASPLRKLPIELPEGVLVKGQVLRPDGRPAGLHRMSFFVEADGGHGFSRDGIVTDANGRFVIEGANPDARGRTYLLIENVEGCQPMRWEVDFGDREQRITLKPGQRISGIVVDRESGRPVVGAEVYATRATYVEGAWPSWFDGGKTDEEGRFSFTNLPSGEFNINTRAGTLVNRYAPAVKAGKGGMVELEVELYEWFNGRLAD